MSPFGKNNRNLRPVWQLMLLAAVLTMAGCKGISQPAERQARRDASEVGSVYRPGGDRPVLPVLTTNSPFSDFMRYAVLNQPGVAAAYYDWQGSVESITVERSLPDPKLTFQAYIQGVLTSLMPGLAQDFPGPGKLKAAARVAAADSQAKYFQFESAVQQAAFNVKRTYYNLYFLDERLRINRETLGLLGDIARNASTQNEVGRATLQDVYRAQIEQDQLATGVANLEDSRASLLAQFKGALGMTNGQPDPPMPAAFESTPVDLDTDALLARAFARNPGLKAMAADVQMAEAGIAVARKSETPDFSAGLQAEVYTPPFYWPQASMTLPIWRDKIAAQIAAAQAGKQAAEARLTSEQIGLAVDLAMKSYECREATRMLVLLENQLVPKARKSLQLAHSGYSSGQIDFSNLIDAERTLLDFQLQEVDARTQRELSLAELSLVIAGVPPAGAPVLQAPRTEDSTIHSTER